MLPLVWVNLLCGCLEAGQEGRIDPGGVPRDTMQYNCIDVVRVLLGQRICYDGSNGEADEDDLFPLFAIDLAIAQLLDKLMNVFYIGLCLSLE